jgi:hypothetical protein
MSLLTIHLATHSDQLNNKDWDLQGFSLTTTTTWQEFHVDNSYFEKEKCAWLSSITFKSKNALKLKQLKLNWEGKKIDTKKISASLYTKKDTNTQLVPLEKNLISDGTWDQDNQKLLFVLDEKLIATNKYYLVISFPDEIKHVMRNGFFKIDNNSLKIEYLN